MPRPDPVLPVRSSYPVNFPANPAFGFAYWYSPENFGVWIACWGQWL